MTALTTTTTALTVTAAAIQTEHKAAQRCASEAVAHAIRAGELLIEAKAALPHGAFGAWLAANVEFSDRTARGYMQLAGLDEAKRQRVADLSLREAMVTIADHNAAEPDSTALHPEAPDEQARAKIRCGSRSAPLALMNCSISPIPIQRSREPGSKP